MDRDRDYDRYRRDDPDERHGYDRDERTWGQRAGDEISSWFGDEEAARRRRMDHLEEDAGDRGDWYADYDDDRGRRDYGRNRGADRNRERYWGDRYGWQEGRYGGVRYGHQGDRYSHGRGAASSYFRGDAGQGAGSYGRDYRSHRRGPHYGHGPEGYTRSAERITEDANEALTWHGELDARNIRVSAEGDEVTLEGTVDSRRAKREAEEAVERVRGVRDVHNRLRVQPAGQQQTQQTAAAGQATQYDIRED